MAKRKFEISPLIGKGHYTYIKDDVEALKQLNSLLSKYPESTRRKVLTQMDKLETTPQKMSLFVQATERYNKHMQKAYNSAVKSYVEPAWKSVVESQSDSWKKRIYTDKGTLSKEGKDVYNNFIKDRLADIVPTEEKSIILSKTQMDRINFEETLQIRLNMGISSYISKRTEQYFKNYETAIREKRKDPDKFLALFNSMTIEQKIQFSYTALGYIKAQYERADEEALYREMEEEINQIKGIS